MPQPTSFSADNPRVARLLATHQVVWWNVATRLEDKSLFALWEDDPAVGIALQIGVAVIADIAGNEREVHHRLATAEGRAELLMEYAYGYGVGRMALGTDTQPLHYSSDEATSKRFGTEIATRAAGLVFEEVLACAENPAALAAAIQGMSADDLARVLRDPLQRLSIYGRKNGFLYAVAEDAVVGGS